MLYKYGMKLRPFSIGCQPKKVYEVREDENNVYWDILIYDRRLTMEEVNDYDLVYLGKVEKSL